MTQNSSQFPFLYEFFRYLVNCSGDTPTVIYAGCRYNALHLAAKSGNLDACQLIMYLINDTTYLNRLYPYCTSPDIAGKRRGKSEAVVAELIEAVE